MPRSIRGLRLNFVLVTAFFPGIYYHRSLSVCGGPYIIPPTVVVAQGYNRVDMWITIQSAFPTRSKPE